jgi:hypothetical protein
MKKREELPVVEGFEPQKKTISMLSANLLAIALFVVVGVLLGIPYLYFYGANELASWNTIFPWFLLLLLVGIVVHELVHGITWLLFTHKGFNHLSFGFLPGGVYCHIDVPMPKRQYVIGALMPLLLVGIVPTLVAFCVGSLLWLLLGIVFIVSAAGDMMIVWAIRNEPTDVLVYDHPSEAGCYVYHKTVQS